MRLVHAEVVENLKNVAIKLVYFKGGNYKSAKEFLYLNYRNFKIQFLLVKANYNFINAKLYL